MGCLGFRLSIYHPGDVRVRGEIEPFAKGAFHPELGRELAKGLERFSIEGDGSISVHWTASAEDRIADLVETLKLYQERFSKKLDELLRLQCSLEVLSKVGNQKTEGRIKELEERVFALEESGLKGGDAP
jgi:polyhydroxyalkanoate synthesis regulator phasin